MENEEPEGTSERYRREFGEELGPPLEALEARLFELHRRWRDYETLYTSDLRVSVLNEFAPSFFSRHQQMTIECIIMAICRITDQDRTFGKENLSLLYLRSLLPMEIRNELEPFVRAASSKSEFAREWRKKRFAHHDLGAAVDQTVVLHPFTHAQVDDAIRAINDFVSEVHVRVGGYDKHPLNHTYRLNDSGGAHVLLQRLHEANKARRMKGSRRRGDSHKAAVLDGDDPVLQDLRRG